MLRPEARCEQGAGGGRDGVGPEGIVLLWAQARSDGDGDGGNGDGGNGDEGQELLLRIGGLGNL